ncbi:MAG: Crp/Fnr family transcriptional regulator [Bryobacteraceae bacterium]
MTRALESDLLVVAARNHILKQLPSSVSSMILEESVLTELQYGRRLFREDGPVETLYFPLSAVVSIVAEISGGGSIEMATVGNEGIAGIGAVLGVPLGLGRTIVQVTGEAVSIGARRFNQIVASEQRLAVLLHRYVYAFLRQILQSGVCNLVHTVLERCARWLLVTHDRAGADEIRLTQDSLAEMIGTRRANVNEALRRLRDAGAIQYVYRRIAVVDRRRLELFSCPCYGAIRRTFELVGV